MKYPKHKHLRTDLHDVGLQRELGDITTSGFILSRRDFLIGTGFTLLTLLATGKTQAQDKPEILKIGILLPQEGSRASFTNSFYAGFEAYCDKSASKSQVQLLKKNSGQDDSKTLEMLAELVMNDKVDILIGPPSPKGLEQTIHGLSTEDTVLFVLSPVLRFVSGEMCRKGSFRIETNSYQRAYPLAPWSIANGSRKVFITGDRDIESNEQADAFAYGFERSGGAFVDRIMTEKPEDIDSIIQKISASDADVVFAAFKEPLAETFLSGCKALKHQLRTAILGNHSLLERIPADAPELTIKTMTFLKEPESFAKKLTKDNKLNDVDLDAAVAGFDTATVIFESFRVLQEKTREAPLLVDHIANSEFSGARKFTFDKNHEPLVEGFLLESIISGGTIKSSVRESLGIVSTPDFGCGRIGFPKKPETEIKDEEPFWDENG